jgi:hypothetical protein
MTRKETIVAYFKAIFRMLLCRPMQAKQLWLLVTLTLDDDDREYLCNVELLLWTEVADAARTFRH